MSIDGIPGGGVSRSEFNALNRQTQTRAAISTAESTAFQALGAGTAAKLLLFDANLDAFNMTADVANNQIVVLEAGQYSAELTGSGSYSTPNIGLEVHILVGAGPRKEPGAHRKISGGGDTGNFSTGPVPLGVLEPGDVVSVEVEGTLAGNLILTDALLTVYRTGD